MQVSSSRLLSLQVSAIGSSKKGVCVGGLEWSRNTTKKLFPALLCRNWTSIKDHSGLSYLNILGSILAVIHESFHF